MTNTADQAPRQQEPEFKDDNEINAVAGAVLQHCVGLTLTDVHRVLKQAGMVANQFCKLMPSPMFDAYAQLVQGSCSAPNSTPLACSQPPSELTRPRASRCESGAPAPTPAPQEPAQVTPSHPSFESPTIKTITTTPTTPSEKDFLIWSQFSGRNHYQLAIEHHVAFESVYDSIHRVSAWYRHRHRFHPSMIEIAMSLIGSIPQLSNVDLQTIIEGLQRDLGGKTYYITRSQSPSLTSGEPAQVSDTGSPPDRPHGPASANSPLSCPRAECPHSPQKPQPM
jgi:Mor family transcriptional regulator